MIELQTETDLFGDDIAGKVKIDREMLAAGLYANLKDISLEEFVSLFVSRIDSIVDYAELCVGSNVGQRISLLFNPHRLSTSTKSCPISLYESLIDERFSRGLSRVMLLKKGRGSRTEGLLYDATAGIGGLNGVSWIQEFPPHVARDLAKDYNLTARSKVLDPCAGWGGRMIGFSAVVDSYTCCEPSTRTAAGLRKLHEWLRVFRKEFTAYIHEAPFEDVVLPEASFDFAMTSPPYYDTERYADEVTNSFNRYPTFDAWCDGFYAPLIHRTMAALKPGASFVLNIGSRVYPLNTKLMQIAEGRYRVEKHKGRLSSSNGLGKDGEGETFYEICNSSGVIYLTNTPQEPQTLAVVSQTSTVEKARSERPATSQAASRARVAPTAPKISALAFALQRRVAPEPSALTGHGGAAVPCTPIVHEASAAPAWSTADVIQNADGVRVWLASRGYRVVRTVDAFTVEDPDAWTKEDFAWFCDLDAAAVMGATEAPAPSTPHVDPSGSESDVSVGQREESSGAMVQETPPIVTAGAIDSLAMTAAVNVDDGGARVGRPAAYASESTPSSTTPTAAPVNAGTSLEVQQGKPADAEPPLLATSGVSAAAVGLVDTVGLVDGFFAEPEQGQTLAQFLGSEPPRVDPNYAPDEPPDLTGVDEVVLNFATSGLRWWAGDRPVGVTVSTLDGQMTRFLPFAFKGGGNLDEAAVKRWVQEQLRGKKIYNTNTRFDLHHSREWGCDLVEQGNMFSDSAHTAALLDDYRRKFALDVLAVDYLPGNVEVPRVDETRHHEYHASEVAARERYTVQLVGRLRAIMYPQIDAQDLRKVHDLEDAVIPSVVECEKNAAFIDRALLKRWVVESETKLNEQLWALAKEVGATINPDSAADWQKLFEHCHIPITEHTEKGAPSFTDALLRTIDHPLVQLARRAGKLASLRSKFLVSYDQAVGDDCKLRFNLHQLRVDDRGTVRGRFSMSDKNLQQVFAVGHQREAFGYDEKDSAHDDEIFLVRKLFIPESGIYASFDMNQVEFRLAAHYANSTKIINAYKQNPDVDFHQVVRDFVAPFKQITRSRAKALSFGKIYGSGKDTVARTLGLPRSEADQIVEIYDRMFPEMKALLRQAAHLAETRGWVKTLMGRRARFPDKKFSHAALNYVVQGSAASVMKRKMIELHTERKTLGFTMRGSIHDEVVGDCVDEESARKVREVLNRQSFDLKIPLTWSMGIGKSWADAK